MEHRLTFDQASGKIILNKKNLLKYYEIKKGIIKEMLTKASIEEDIQRWNNQLNLIESLIDELDLFS